jgi:hypothetical protein
LATVDTWGTKFFIPVSHLTKDRVRIVALEDNTNIIQFGGEIKSAVGSQMSLDNLQAGQFVELEVTLGNKGCYIEADKRIEVCTYLTGQTYHDAGHSDPAQAWLPAIEQTIPNALIAPFIPVQYSHLDDHRALVLTPTGTKTNTKVSIGGAPPEPLSGGIWYDNGDAEMSFYNMPLTDETASYYFTNDAGLIVMCYGVGTSESYYYLAGSAMRNLQLAFYANDIYYTELPDGLFCERTINFHAEVSGITPSADNLKWYIRDLEEPTAAGETDWTKTFTAPGAYKIELWVQPETGEAVTISSTLHIGAIVNVVPRPGSGSAGGSIEGGGCYKIGDKAELRAMPGQ